MALPLESTATAAAPQGHGCLTMIQPRRKEEPTSGRKSIHSAWMGCPHPRAASISSANVGGAASPTGGLVSPGCESRGGGAFLQLGNEGSKGGVEWINAPKLRDKAKLTDPGGLGSTLSRATLSYAQLCPAVVVVAQREERVACGGGEEGELMQESSMWRQISCLHGTPRHKHPGCTLPALDTSRCRNGGGSGLYS
jgi:hypothetical protein